MYAAFLISVTTVIHLCQGGAVTSLQREGPTKNCGEWAQYKDEKCIKIVAAAGLQSREDAEVICRSFADHSDIPRLMTIKTVEEQEFLTNFLFEKNGVIEQVWLGVKETEQSGVFKWDDGTEVFYSNWANQNVTDKLHGCVQIESGEGTNESGLWVRVSCKKRNVVVCEKTQTWTLERIQTFLLKMNADVDDQKDELEKQHDYIDDLKNKLEETNSFIDTLKISTDERMSICEGTRSHGVLVASGAYEGECMDVTVPAGFVYTQLPGKEPPSTLWPLVRWKDITEEYAGLFFRALGGDAAPFGEIQEARSVGITQVQYGVTSSSIKPVDSINIPTDGQWSQYVKTGQTYSGSTYYGLSFHISRGDIRPRNQGVKIWQRLA